MKTLRLVLGDQLNRSISSLDDIDPKRDVVLMAEVHDEATYVPHHQQKIVLVLSAMRHFAELLACESITVDYVRMSDEGNTGSFTGELERALKRNQCERVVVTEPGEWRVDQMMQKWEACLGVPVEIRQDNRFFCSLDGFADWAEGRKNLRMEFFYRQMRRETGWLMEGDKPLGERWNYDSENRKSLPKDKALPRRNRFEPDPITQEVIKLVSDRFGDHFGELEHFGWAVTREDALQALDDFVSVCLPDFGNYQDAMKSGEDFLFHGLVSPYLNLGLLLPREVCEAALQALEHEEAPLAAVEGFVRQILGWREYVRGLYWLKMPDYAQSNYLNAKRPLPEFYWTARTELNCLRQTIESTRDNAYAHHIQRLMVTGNFALLAGLEPAEVEDWYLRVYADAFEWVELPNTHGMALYADGGVMASKPYAASGAYINRMSDYCADCKFDPKQKLGEKACPFNYLYWHFLIRNQDPLKSNPRMGLAYRNLDRMDPDQQSDIVEQAERFLDALDE
ncbi:MAG: cryptochrome/photolyase family protein [Xanthomonadales bacterium]|nr:cryptochrome/photolyase family protein [Gammaproteobacteria bacterium]MBT8054315.1 cryptochrome/photolyase family protein [Gammaproteobacteria bacterium]NND57492.1 cryptochrome/photolyase family protein [Xanthomonadales bacterium]NNK51216.1 cryptochrome/photolyase family protein [Xanthomonadales bacterium]